MTTKRLHIGKGQNWPIDAVTETFGIFGTRGSGKSTTAKVLVEELTAVGQQCVIVDPLGVWFGLKSSASGEVEGYPFTIIGGQRADVPINDRAGPIIADLVIDTTAPLIIDLSQMRKAEGRRFMAAFVEHLWHRANGKPVHVVVDECDLFAPMRPIKGAEALLGSMEDLVRRGRNKGLGSTMISQRPASVHTDIRSQVSVLIAHRLTGTHDRAALDAWVEAHGDRDRRAEMMAGLASLPTGTAWMWSPSFLDLFAVVAVRAPWTFDSMATPKAGEKRIEPKALAAPDIEALTAKMASIVEEAEANDPRLLRKRITVLEAALNKVGFAEPQRVIETVEVEVVPQALIEHLGRIKQMLQDGLGALGEILYGWPSFDGVNKPKPRRAMAELPTPAAPPPTFAHKVAKGLAGEPVRDTGLGKAEAALLNVLVQFPHGRNKNQLAFLSGYSARSSSFSNALGVLRSRGLVDRGNPIIRATAAATDAINVEALPTGPALLDYWMARLGKAERTMMLVILDAWPDELTKTELADQSGYSATSSSFSNALGTLRKLEMIERSTIVATDDFAKAVQ